MYRKNQNIQFMRDLLTSTASVDFANAVRNGDKQVAQITINIVAYMLEENTKFVQTYLANPDFLNFVNIGVFQAAVSQLSTI